MPNNCIQCVQVSLYRHKTPTQTTAPNLQVPFIENHHTLTHMYNNPTRNIYTDVIKNYSSSVTLQPLRRVRTETTRLDHYVIT